MTGGQIGNVDLVKQLNGAAVYRLIDQQGPISRIQIAELSHLAPASVTKITRQLLEFNLVQEVAQQASTGGRRAISLTTQTAPFHSIAIRVGRDYIQMALHDLSGDILAQTESPFHYTDQEQLVSQLIDKIRLFKAGFEEDKYNLIAIGITLPGLVNPDEGEVHYMPNTKIDRLPLAKLITEQFNIECFVGNDIRAMALAEHYFGATKNCMDSVLISVHRGTGSGIMAGGQVFLGSNRNVGEIGHIQVDPLGEQCQCGNFGCLETIASNPAIIKGVNTRLARGYNSTLADEPNVTIKTICEHALLGDALATQSIVRVGVQLGKAIAIVINLFNPQKIVIAGDITQAKEVLFSAIQRNVNSQSLSAFNKDLPIVSSDLEQSPTMGPFAMIKRAMLNGMLLQKLMDSTH
ncbi:transcriptional regulator [Vibrio sp. UCD-FRSSP16_10]|uniref:DNA-binding transcriptional regulator NagC n=1 Tax=unclassified Vibrio TaxID=2614977 RepID=UPI0007FD6B1D|nr:MULTISPECIES: ROK family protein [unclassified Vibrio]OBT08602.1 transcriptional regulator [Vibrio sp. UCD-FRSSP16_30]OBT18132.1 transcriptional regulator [Vibrio sp. UCD-FRSSP16_10]